MKNLKTPRTLAECEFTTGHRQAELQRSGARAEAVVLAIALACLVGFALGWLA